MDAFDADVLIYAVRGHPSGAAVMDLFEAVGEGIAGFGSVLLVPELLIKPTRLGDETERDALTRLLSRLELVATDRATSELAVSVGAKYGLKALDATHLATAIVAGADRFVTNNRRDFRRDTINEVEIVYPDAPNLLAGAVRE